MQSILISVTSHSVLLGFFLLDHSKKQKQKQKKQTQPNPNQQKAGEQGKPALCAVICISPACSEAAEIFTWANLNPPPPDHL